MTKKFELADKKSDKKSGIKEGSKRDNKIDAVRQALMDQGAIRKPKSGRPKKRK